MGHIKTICVLAGGALLFQEVITLRIVVGMTCAVLGMMGYGYFTHQETQLYPGGGPSVKGADAKGGNVPEGEEEATLLSVPSTDSHKKDNTRQIHSEPR